MRIITIARKPLSESNDTDGSGSAMSGFESLDLRASRPLRDSEEESRLVDIVFNSYRKAGFPYPPCPDIRKSFHRLQKTKVIFQMQKGLFTQSMVGLSLANSYHRQMVSVRCRNFNTPLEVFEDDSLLKEAILKRIRYGDHLKPWGLRKSIYSMRRTQRVSNFRPTVARDLFSFFKPSLIVDPCMGWGGRMLGAMAGGYTYVGIDPNEIAVRNNLQMLSDIQGVVLEPFNVQGVVGCAEDLLGKSIWNPDLVMTSPPYFDVEKYTNEPTQSYIRFPTEMEWYEGFLRSLIRGSYQDLMSGGFLVLNVNADMVERTKKISKEEGFIFHRTWGMLLSQHQFNKSTGGTYKTEPILVFGKGSGSVLRLQRLEKNWTQNRQGWSIFDLFGIDE